MNEVRPSGRSLFGSFLASFSRSRRLEDRIRRLSADAVAATDPVEANRILEDLGAALRLHAERLRVMATDRSSSPERRQPTSTLG